MQYCKPDNTAQTTQWTELVTCAKILLSLYRAKTHCLEYFVMNHWQLKLNSRRPAKYTVGNDIYKLFYENWNFVQLLFICTLLPDSKGWQPIPCYSLKIHVAHTPDRAGCLVPGSRHRAFSKSLRSKISPWMSFCSLFAGKNRIGWGRTLGYSKEPLTNTVMEDSNFYLLLQGKNRPLECEG